MIDVVFNVDSIIYIYNLWYPVRIYRYGKVFNFFNCVILWLNVYSDAWTLNQHNKIFEKMSLEFIVKKPLIYWFNINIRLDQSCSLTSYIENLINFLRRLAPLFTINFNLNILQIIPIMYKKRINQLIISCNII